MFDDGDEVMFLIVYVKEGYGGVKFGMGLSNAVGGVSKEVGDESEPVIPGQACFPGFKTVR